MARQSRLAGYGRCWFSRRVAGCAHLWDMNPDTDNLLEPLLSVPDLAEYLGVPVQTIYDWRLRGEGPRAYRFGKRIKFAVSDVRAWVDCHRVPDAPDESGTAQERG